MFGGYIIHILDRPLWGCDPQINYQTVHFPESNSNIYMSARAWGLTGDHEEVRLCTEQINFCESFENNECITFSTDKIFYRKENPNSLHIYAVSSRISKDQSKRLGQISIVFDELKNYDQINDLENNHEKRGIAMIAIP